MRSFCVVLASIACLAACGGKPSDKEQAQIPKYEAVSVDGAAVTLASLRGNAVLLNVWATWCGPCREEIPFLASLQRREAAHGLHVVGVSVDAAADHAKVVESAGVLGLTYDLWLDPEERIAGVLRYSGLPASMLLDRNGAVVWKHVGVLRETTPGFADALGRALSGRSAAQH
jgi:cytochrome c biogenesis protein CcmG, thiol:disulfide interchange protein DsbE